jgi:ribonuclease P protein component
MPSQADLIFRQLGLVHGTSVEIEKIVRVLKKGVVRALENAQNIIKHPKNAKKNNLMNIKQTFPKSEHLCSKKIIGSMFGKTSQAQSAFVFPIKAVYLTDNEELIIDNEKVLYTNNDSINNKQQQIYPLSIIHYPLLIAPQVLFSVSKRSFKRAVDRNLIRRRIKEAYRLNKSFLANNFPPYIAFIYVAKEILPYQNIEKSIKSVLKKLK